jgi:nucleoside-diphosphate-sugar epimerase
MENVLREDLDHILANTRELWEEIRGKRIFITGGTGFFGCWLLESFAWANDHLGLNADALVLTRNLESFRQKAPHLVSHPAIKFHIGDVRDFEFPGGEFSHIIHAATEANATLNDEDPVEMVDVIIQGTRRTLDLAVRCAAKKFLLVSSGAVYGRQPSTLTHMHEDYKGAPDTMDTASAYGEGKRLAELFCAIYAKQYGLEAKIARCFAFVGPHMSLDTHFAIGNFIGDALRGGPIMVKGDGSPYRSYLYAADLAVWLWTILFRGRSCVPYNVGSDRDMTIAEVAEEVAECFTPRPSVHISKEVKLNEPRQRYVPLVEKAKRELNLKQGVSLREAVKKTALFFGQGGTAWK